MSDNNQRNTGLLSYQLCKYIEDKLINYTLSSEQAIDIDNIINNWYNITDRRFNNLPQREEFNRIVDYYRHRIGNTDELYLYEYYLLLSDVADVILHYNLRSYSRDIVVYLAQRLGNIDETYLYPLIHSLDSLKRHVPNNIRLDTRQLDRLKMLLDECNNDEAYQVITELYNIILQSLGHPNSKADVDNWEDLTIHILNIISDPRSTINTRCQYIRGYIQQLFKSYYQAKRSHIIDIPRPTKNVVIIG